MNYILVLSKSLLNLPHCLIYQNSEIFWEYIFPSFRILFVIKDVFRLSNINATYIIGFAFQNSWKQNIYNSWVRLKKLQTKMVYTFFF